MCICSSTISEGSWRLGGVARESCSALLMETWKYRVPFSNHCCFQCTNEMSATVPDISAETKHTTECQFAPQHQGFTTLCIKNFLLTSNPSPISGLGASIPIHPSTAASSPNTTTAPYLTNEGLGQFGHHATESKRSSALSTPSSSNLQLPPLAWPGSSRTGALTAPQLPIKFLRDLCKEPICQFGSQTKTEKKNTTAK